jgi:hypothetical protein
VVYKGKDGSQQKTFNALEWLAAIGAQLPAKSEHKGFAISSLEIRLRKIADLVQVGWVAASVKLGNRLRQSQKKLFPDTLDDIPSLPTLQ